MKKLILSILFILLSAAVTAGPAWNNQCPDAPGCENVGKTAYNNAHWLKPGKARDNIESVPLGEVAGVTWRPAGTVIAVSDDVRTAPEDGWYYIINNEGGGEPFLRRSRDIKLRQ